jgi:hypothetical protein
MHILSERNRAEFSACPTLVRATLAKGANGIEPTVLLKASTLTLKYIIRGCTLEFLFVRLHDGLVVYCIAVHDDPIPAYIWSVIESQDELDALRALASAERCTIFLFNELVFSVAWAELTFVQSAHDELLTMLNSASVCHDCDRTIVNEVEAALDIMASSSIDEASLRITWPSGVAWHELSGIYITNRAQGSPVSIFETDEGAQQEQMALWLIDSLHPDGAVFSPQVYLQQEPRELSDLLLTHRYGAFLFESKALSILARNALPSRAKLTTRLIKYVRRATNQLTGGFRSLRTGHRITDKQGNDVGVERNAIGHAIIVVPDLDLLSYTTEFNGTFLREFAERTQAFLHILDIPQLFRMAQAGQMIAARKKTTTPLMAFDVHLMRRFQLAIEQPSPAFDFLVGNDSENGNTDDA